MTCAQSWSLPHNSSAPPRLVLGPKLPVLVQMSTCSESALCVCAEVGNLFKVSYLAVVLSTAVLRFIKGWQRSSSGTLYMLRTKWLVSHP